MRFGIIANRKRVGADAVIRRVINWSVEHGHQYLLCEDLKGVALESTLVKPRTELASLCDCIVSMGGDGTLLATARAVGAREVPILGINLGSLGFLTQVTEDKVEESLAIVAEGKHRVEKRMLLSAFVEGHEKTTAGFALNDVVVDRGSVARLVELNLYVNEEFISTYRADGLIISTPTGSTAYNAAVGGPILDPNMEAILASPMASQSLAARSLLFRGNDRIKIEILSKHDEGTMTIDGQVAMTLKNGDTIFITRAKHVANLITFPQHSFYEILRNKLHWAVLPKTQAE